MERASRIPGSADEKAEKMADQASASSEAPDKYYYSDLQVLTETVVDGTCPEDKRLTDEVQIDSPIHLNDKLKIEGYDQKKVPARLFFVNVNLQAIGFDRAKFSFMAVDGKVPLKIPFGMHFKRTPGNVLEMTFLDQVQKMNLKQVPVYTFSATEKRENCTLIHNVNVFSERTGYYRLAE